MSSTLSFVLGTRPEIIKLSPVIRACQRRDVSFSLIHTGQHYSDELDSVFFEELDLSTPEYNLAVGSKNHGEQTGEMIAGIESVLEEERPDFVLVQGDTNSVLAGTIAAAKLDNIEVGHVEAGLRSFDREMPEEINRVLTDHTSDLLFAPSERAVDNLEAEGITDGVHNVGDVMYDSVLWARETAVDRSTIHNELDIVDEAYLLATVHRPRNTDDRARLETILTSLAADPREVVFPAHPRTIDRLERYGLRETAETELTLVDPVGYVDFLALQAGAAIIVTDSGGVQKEAFFLDVPCVTLREETEWPETVEAGGNVLVGADAEMIGTALSDPPQSSSGMEPYGDGTAAEQIVGVLDDLSN